MTTREQRIALDGLIHDAEHAEGGAEFARQFMADERTARRLDQHAERLRAEARALAEALAEALGVALCPHQRPADECCEDGCYVDDEDAP